MVIGTVMTLDQLQGTAARMTVPPGWRLTVGRDHWGLPEVRFRSEVPDARHPGETTVLDIASPIPPMDSDDQWRRWLKWRLGIIFLHEVDEYVTYDGALIDDPHRAGG